MNIELNNTYSKLYKYKDFLFLYIFYTFGLIIGTVLFSKLHLNTLLSNLLSNDTTEFLLIYKNYLCTYLFAFTITLLLGLCLVGFPIINLIPFIVGLEIAVKLSYYYTSYNIKGIGYSLLLIIPEFSLFVTILFYAINNGKNLSINIYNSTTKKDTDNSTSLNLYLKSYLLYLFIIVGIAFINSLLQYLLSPIINIKS